MISVTLTHLAHAVPPGGLHLQHAYQLSLEGHPVDEACGVRAHPEPTRTTVSCDGEQKVTSFLFLFLFFFN